jgi:dTMP kinase
MPKRGVLITFEGVEGSGKTTQANALAQWCGQRSIPCVLVREPGGTRVGEKIRDILLDCHNAISPKCEVLLFLAARSQLVHEKVHAALDAKKVVIADRFSDSTYAYQTYARHLPERLVAVMNRFASAGLKPDLTFIVDIDVAAGRARGKFADRMETEAEHYHRKVRDGYLRLARRAKKRIRVLDGTKTADALKIEVQDHVRDILIRKGYET